MQGRGPRVCPRRRAESYTRRKAEPKGGGRPRALGLQPKQEADSLRDAVRLKEMREAEGL